MKISIFQHLVELDNGEELFITRTTQRDGSCLWKVYNDNEQMTLNRDLEWEFEPRPSSRTDEYLARNRFSYVKAFEIVEKYSENSK